MCRRMGKLQRSNVVDRFPANVHQSHGPPRAPQNEKNAPDGFSTFPTTRCQSAALLVERERIVVPFLDDNEYIPNQNQASLFARVSCGLVLLAEEQSSPGSWWIESTSPS